MSTPYFAILTAVGEAKHQNAAVLGTKVNYATMAVGDGNGEVPIPNRLQTQLVNEVRREAINAASIDPENGSQIIIEQVIPETEGGWWIREAGIYDDVGDLIAVASLPPTYKPQMLEGSGRTQVVRIVLLLANASVVSLKIDPAVVLATRQYADALFNQPSGVEAGTYGSAYEYPTFTVDSRGRVVSAGVVKTVSVWDLIPDEYMGDIIFVKGLGEMWWTENPWLTGYRTKNCGLPAQTLDRAARSWTISLRGGTFDRSLKKYRGLYSWIMENDLMVAAEDYVDGEGFFADLGDNIIKVPNQDNQFWRNIGTDLDTANARALGSKQTDAMQRIVGEAHFRPATGIGGGALGGLTSGVFTAAIKGGSPGASPIEVLQSSGNADLLAIDTALNSRTSSETRGSNAALHPRIFL